MRKIAIIGGGVSGLACAHRLLRERPDWSIKLFEASERVGGLLASERIDGHLIELGADSILCDSQDVYQWFDELGLRERIIHTRAENRGAYIVSRGEFRRIPAGTSILGTADIAALWRSDLLSWRGKMRAAIEPYIPCASKDDESIYSFVRRRYGKEYAEHLAAPIVRGIYGEDSDTLSLQANLPRFAQLEAMYGSVTRGLADQESSDSQQAAQGARYGMFVTFPNGMQEMVDAFQRSIGLAIELRSRIKSIEKQDDTWRVLHERGEFAADAVVLACSAQDSADLLRSTLPSLSQQLKLAASGPAAIATFAWPKSEVARALDAFGFVVEPADPSSVAACTWSSIKWPERAPHDQLLLRVFVNEMHLSSVSDDNSLLDIVQTEISSLMHASGEPTLRRLQCWTHVMPRYRVGHLNWLAQLREELNRQTTTLALIGNSYSGIGVPAALASGKIAASKLISLF